MSSLRNRVSVCLVQCVFFSLVLLGSSRAAKAQTAYYSGITSVVGSGFREPYGVAVDSRGNIFVADSGHNMVKEIVAVNGQVSSSSTVIVVGSGFSYPHGVAVDASGNVFVGDTLNGAVKEIVAVNGQVSSSSTVNTVASGLDLVSGVAVDASGNVFFAENDANAVKEIVAVNGQVSSSSAVVVVGSGFSNPLGVAVDASGDVFVADHNNRVVKEIVAVNGQVSSTSTVVTVGSGFNGPFGVALDPSSDVFVADDEWLKEIVAANGQVSSTSTVLSVGNPFSDAFAVAADASGDVFFADPVDNSSVKEVQFGSVNFGSVNVASTSSTMLVPFTFTAGGQLSGWSVLTQGATGKDFAEVPDSTTCSTTTTYNTGDICSVAVRFSPLHPGMRMGAVQLLDSTGAVIATARLKGIGVGPQIVFPSNSGSNVVGNVAARLGGVAVDANGDVFFGDLTHGMVKEIVAVNGQVSSTSQLVTVASGLQGPYGVAVDSSGDVFVAVSLSGVKEIVAVNGQVSSASRVVTLASDLSEPDGVAVDASGNVFFSEYGSGAVKEIVAVNGQVSSTSTTVTVGSGFSGPKGLAVDASGDLFFAEAGDGAVKEIVALNGQVSSTSQVVTVGSGFIAPQQLAVDASGNVFLTEPNLDAVKEIVAVNGQVSSTSQVVTVGSGFGEPSGVAVDASGNLFVTEFLNTEIKELPLATAPSHTFPTATALGSTDSTDGPFTFTVANDGNAPLTFPPPATGTNPSVSTNFAWDEASSCDQIDTSSSPFTLAEGASCTAAIDFGPTTGGSIAGSVVLTDDSLNANPSTTQTISLSGTSIVVPQTAINYLIGQVEALYPATLTSGQENSLLKELRQTSSLLSKGKISGAISNLQDYISELKDLESSGVLTSAQAQPLIDVAQLIINQL